MNIFLDDITSLALIRAVARDSNGLAVVQSSVTTPQPLGLRTAKLDRLGMPELLGYLRIPELQPLGIVIPAPKNRIRAKDFRCTVCSSPRGSAPFLQLVATDAQSSGLVPSTTQVNVMSPANIVLQTAGRLRANERSGKITHNQAVLTLFKLCLELCGTYSHHPFEPLNGAATYHVEPRLDAKTLRTMLETPGRERGLTLAREAAQLAYNNSGSPQETFLGPALFFPTHLGGMHLCDFEANVSLNLSKRERASIGYRHITPDFTLAQYRTVVEYLGKVHFEGDNPKIDHQRSLDYQTLGFREFNFWYDDVRTRARFMQSAARVVAAIAAYEGPKAQQRYLKLAKNKDFIKRQRMLFEVFCPWLQ